MIIKNYTSHYDINGKEVVITECATCRHQIDISELITLKLNGCPENNPLIIMDKIAGCCKFPNYFFPYTYNEV